MSNDAAWAESVQQFQQMLSQSWGNMLQAMQPGELNKAMAMPPSTPVNFAGDKLLELQQQYLQDMRALWGQGMLPQMPKTGDRRFAGENWAQNPLSVYSVTAYQMQARALMGMVDAVEADEKTRARIRFGVEQWLAAMSPSNFLAFNADAQKKAIETHGESIAKGVANLLHDMRQGHISMTDESRFEVGRNVATTEGAVVFENELFQLLEYKPLTAKVYERPFLMVPPCINKYYILDLQPENSVIRYAVSQGHRTFVISWRNPDESLGHKTWDDYIEQAVLTAIAKTQEISGVEKINALGFCVGGTMLTNALAVLAARGQDVVASATFLTTLINFADTGILDVFIDENFVRMREMQMGQGGLMKGQDLASTFSFLRPNELVWNYVVGNYLKGETPPPFDLLYWN
ncbi:MAG TPA: alpha/beta fold hydrolase, partial [Alicycliphilus sp.]|nr:alpha/beta fold hydrolase [Alicycliphilus sp.]